MIPTLSTRTFKHLRKISRKSGFQAADEEIIDMGIRLLNLCQIAANVKNREERAVKDLLTKPEMEALGILRLQFTVTGRLLSARELSSAMKYQSSRSGHLLLQGLFHKGFLVKRNGRLTFVLK
jgi:hypothetical protein